MTIINKQSPVKDTIDNIAHVQKGGGRSTNSLYLPLDSNKISNL